MFREELNVPMTEDIADHLRALERTVVQYIKTANQKHLDSEIEMEDDFNIQISELREELQKSESDRINLKGEVEALNNVIRLLGRVMK